jgi:hypothetical protein
MLGLPELLETDFVHGDPASKLFCSLNLSDLLIGSFFFQCSWIVNLSRHRALQAISGLLRSMRPWSLMPPVMPELVYIDKIPELHSLGIDNLPLIYTNLNAVPRDV